MSAFYIYLSALRTDFSVSAFYKRKMDVAADFSRIADEYSRYELDGFPSKPFQNPAIWSAVFGSEKNPPHQFCTILRRKSVEAISQIFVCDPRKIRRAKFTMGLKYRLRKVLCLRLSYSKCTQLEVERW